MAVTLKSDDLGGLGQRVEGAYFTLCSPESDALRPRHLGTLCGHKGCHPQPTNASQASALFPDGRHHAAAAFAIGIS